MAGGIYLLDTSAWVHRNRNESVRDRVDTLILGGRVATCDIVALEVLDNPPDLRAYKAPELALLATRWLPTGESNMERARGVHRTLAETGQHRHFSLPDLIIAATAEDAGVTVLHYDSDYDRIAAITGQPMEWVAPKGSL